MIDLGFFPVAAHVRNTSLGTAVTITAPAGASKVLMQAFAQNVRFTLDSTTPTSAVGFQLKAGDPPTLIPINATKTLKVIEEAGGGEIQYIFGN